MGKEQRDASGGDGRAQPPVEPPRVGVVERLRALWANPLLRFIVLFLLYLTAAAAAYPALRDRYRFVLDVLRRGTARLEYYIFRVFTPDVSSPDTLVVFQGTAVKIIEECTGVYEAIIFASAVLAFPTSWKKRLIGLLLGCPLIYLFNAVRITTLIATLHYYPSIFDFVHLYFWQATLILMIMSVWALWFFKVVLREEKGRPSHA
ncbi:MAG: archaeosortase/exosortase family protein [Myxococcota bacterium]